MTITNKFTKAVGSALLVALPVGAFGKPPTSGDERVFRV
jgi:hypothetical protein